MSVKPLKQKILIVDDMPANIKVLGQVLRNEYEIVIATSGPKALELAASDNPPDLVLLDIEMPGMDGYEVCKRLKNEDKTRNISIIFVTAKKEEDDETRGLELGAVDYIVKPFSIPIVKARVKTHLKLKVQTDLLEELTSLDPLTNVANRRRLDEVLKIECSRSRRSGSSLSLIFLDVDYFKSFNDIYGHAAGDECLIKVAAALKSALYRDTDFVARYGGEEFVAVLPETDLQAAIFIAERIKREIAGLKIEHAGSDVADQLSVSMGVLSNSAEDYSYLPVEMIKAADALLYTAKEQGRNRIVSGED